MSTAKELRELNLDDLRRRADDLRETLMKDQLKLRSGGLDSPSERTAHKRDLARVLGVITEKRVITEKATSERGTQRHG